MCHLVIHNLKRGHTAGINHVLIIVIDLGHGPTPDLGHLPTSDLGHVPTQGLGLDPGLTPKIGLDRTLDPGHGPIPGMGQGRTPELGHSRAPHLHSHTQDQGHQIQVHGTEKVILSTAIRSRGVGAQRPANTHRIEPAATVVVEEAYQVQVTER